MQKVNLHDEADNKSEKIITDTNTVTNTCTRIIPLQTTLSFTYMYITINNSKVIKKFGYLKQIYNKLPLITIIPQY